jgi:hypothetical protein
MKSRIALLEGHSADNDQIIKIDGTPYLKDAFSERPAVYESEEAVDKAREVRGVAKPVNSKYDLSYTVTIAQIVEQNIPQIVLNAFALIEPSYVDADKSIGEKIYSTDAIYESMAQEAYDNDDTELEIELRELYDYVSDYSYVTFTKC